MHYGISALQGQFEKWNNVLPHGFDANNAYGNLFLGIHLLFAATISFCGPLQIIPQIRSRVPRLHRVNGRIYLTTALIMSISGLYLGLSGRKLVGDSSQHIALLVNSLLILCFGFMALRTAILGQFATHRQWALRLFLAVSGVWFFRIGLMAWLVIFGKPVGFDKSTFSGPFLTGLAWGVYVAPVALLQIYFIALKNRSAVARIMTASGISLITLLTAIGLFGATMGMWLPRLR